MAEAKVETTKKEDLVKDPKAGLKDPVMIAGKWEERNPPPVTAGKTRAVPDEYDKEHLEDVKDKEFLERSDYLAAVKKPKSK